MPLGSHVIQIKQKEIKTNRYTHRLGYAYFTAKGVRKAIYPRINVETPVPNINGHYQVTLIQQFPDYVP